MGVNFANDNELIALAEAVNAHTELWTAAPSWCLGAASKGALVEVTDPADRRRRIGQYPAADDATVEKALANAHGARERWNNLPVPPTARRCWNTPPSSSRRAAASSSRYACARPARPARRDRRDPRGGRLPALLRHHGASSVRRARSAARPHRREQPAVSRAAVCSSASAPWNFPLHLPATSAKLAAGNPVIACWPSRPA